MDKPTDEVLSRAFIVLASALRHAAKKRPGLWALVHEGITQVQSDAETWCRANDRGTGEVFLQAVEVVRETCCPNIVLPQEPPHA